MPFVNKFAVSCADDSEDVEATLGAQGQCQNAGGRFMWVRRAAAVTVLCAGAGACAYTLSPTAAAVARRGGHAAGDVSAITGMYWDDTGAGMTAGGGGASGTWAGDSAQGAMPSDLCAKLISKQSSHIATLQHEAGVAYDLACKKKSVTDPGCWERMFMSIQTNYVGHLKTAMFQTNHRDLLNAAPHFKDMVFGTPGVKAAVTTMKQTITSGQATPQTWQTFADATEAGLQSVCQGAR